MQEELNKKIERKMNKKKLEILDNYILMNNVLDTTKEITKDEIINNLESYLQFNNYFHKKYYNRNCIVTDIYNRSFGDICADVILSYNDYPLSKVTLKIDNLEDSENFEKNYDLLKEAFKNIAFENFDELIRLPKLLNFLIYLIISTTKL